MSWLGFRDLSSLLFTSEKFLFYQTRSRAAPVTEISDFATDISVMGTKIFPYKRSSPGDRDETFFDKIASLTQRSGRNGIIFVWYVFTTEVVIKLKQSTIVANDTSLCSTILVLFLELHPRRPGNRAIRPGT